MAERYGLVSFATEPEIPPDLEAYIVLDGYTLKPGESKWIPYGSYHIDIKLPEGWFLDRILYTGGVKVGWDYKVGKWVADVSGDGGLTFKLMPPLPVFAWTPTYTTFEILPAPSPQPTLMTELVSLKVEPQIPPEDAARIVAVLDGYTITVGRGAWIPTGSVLTLRIAGIPPGYTLDSVYGSGRVYVEDYTVRVEGDGAIVVRLITPPPPPPPTPVEVAPPAPTVPVVEAPPEALPAEKPPAEIPTPPPEMPVVEVPTVPVVEAPPEKPSPAPVLIGLAILYLAARR